MRALDGARTVAADGLIAQPFHPFTSGSVAAMPADGSPVEVDVEIFPTAWELRPGDTLQLTLQTSDAPHLSPTAPETENGAGSALSVYHDAGHDSEVSLPVQSAALSDPPPSSPPSNTLPLPECATTPADPTCTFTTGAGNKSSDVVNTSGTWTLSDAAGKVIDTGSAPGEFPESLKPSQTYVLSSTGVTAVATSGAG
jgi:hypothetical protein